MKVKKLVCVIAVLCMVFASVFTFSASAATLGDVDSNGTVNPLDVVILTRYLAEWEGYDAKVNLVLSDVNNDGSVDPIDPVILARHLAGWQGYGVLPYGSDTGSSESAEFIPGIW